MLFSVWMSFHQWDPAEGLSAMHWVGIDNYTYTLHDGAFFKSLWNTVWLAVVAAVPQQLVALPLAFALHTAFGRWRNAVAGAYFLPFITSSVAISLVFTTIFSRDFGAMNGLIDSLHALPLVGGLFPARHVDWFNESHVRWVVAIVVWWRYTGWITVLYLAALQTVPRELYEAAKIDGARAVQQFFHITLPMLRPMMFFTVSLNLIGGLQLFEEPFILTGGTGGAGRAARTAAMHLYSTAFVDGDFGTASAVAWLLFLFIGVLAFVNGRVFAQSGLKEGE